MDGKQLGLRLRLWLLEKGSTCHSNQAIVAWFMDAIGDDDLLRAPLKDIGSQHSLLQALLRDGAQQILAVNRLREYIEHTYARRAKEELFGMIEAATGVVVLGSASSVDGGSQSDEASPKRKEVRVEPVYRNGHWGYRYHLDG